VRAAIALACWLLLASAMAGAAEPGKSGTLHVLSYHDVRDSVAGDFDRDQYAVSAANLIEHFRWLKANGYTPVSIDQLLAAREGRGTLPDKPVLLTFDDGLRSMYTHVLPLLRLFGYPAVASLVTAWIERDASVPYAGRELGRKDFLSWRQVRELQESGLVEIASHSHDLHKGIRGNPQGNQQPAAVTRLYDGERYESGAQRAARVRDDLATSVRIIREHTGLAPRVMTWPYGAFDAELAAIAAQLGMGLSLTLQPNHGIDPAAPLLHRHLVEANPGIASFAAALMAPPYNEMVRAAQVDLDYVYGPGPAQQERNLDRLVERVHVLELSHVFLQAFSDPDGDGGSDALYFPNRHLPVRADLFNRAAWQLRTRAGVRVYAWLPLLSFHGGDIPEAWRVLQAGEAGPRPDPYSEPRLSPFHAGARQLILDIYEDLAAHARFDGLHFHDDGRLNQAEDANPAALQAYSDFYGESINPAGKLAPEAAARWTDLKVRTLLSLTDEISQLVARYQPGLKTSRNLFATALTDPTGPLYLAQDFQRFLRHYDYVTVMAMPYLEGADNQDQAREFYRELLRAPQLDAQVLERTVFQVQTVDWREGRPVPSEEVRRTMLWLQSQGVRNLAYYPDDFIRDHPSLSVLRQGISLARYPWSVSP